jgi:hypothetical protein
MSSVCKAWGLEEAIYGMCCDVLTAFLQSALPACSALWMQPIFPDAEMQADHIPDPVYRTAVTQAIHHQPAAPTRTRVPVALSG